MKKLIVAVCIVLLSFVSAWSADTRYISDTLRITSFSVTGDGAGAATQTITECAGGRIEYILTKPTAGGTAPGPYAIVITDSFGVPLDGGKITAVSATAAEAWWLYLKSAYGTGIPVIDTLTFTFSSLGAGGDADCAIIWSTK